MRRDTLHNADPQLRRVTIVLCESSGKALLFADVMNETLFDDDPAVRFQARTTAPLLQPRGVRDGRQFAKHAAADAEDPWQRQAIKLSLNPRNADFT